MYQQQKPPSEHSGLAVVLGWTGGVPLSIWAWPHVDPFILRLLVALKPTIGLDFAAFLYNFIAPIAFFLLVLYGIMFFVDEVVIHNFRQNRALTDFERARGVVFKEGKEDSGWAWIGWVFVALMILGALGDKT